jgi:hypothetical protein
MRINPMARTDPENIAPQLPGPLLQGAFAGPQAFSQLVRDALASAAHEGWAEMVWSDATLEDWPLREKAVVQSLQNWARSGRRLVLLAQPYESVRLLQPRFVSWRVMWDHIIECRVCKNVDSSEFPSAILSRTWSMRRLDLARSTGMAGYEPQRRLQLQEALDECRKQSSPGFPASVLGL